MRAWPYPHTRTRPVLILSRSLSISLRLSLAGPCGGQSGARGQRGPRRRRGGWVTVEQKVALPPPPWRAVRGIRLLHQVSSSGAWDLAPPSGPPSSAASSCSSKLPPARALPSLSLSPLISALVHCTRCHMPWHADNGALLELMEDVQIWKAMSEYAVAPVSSGGSDGSSLKRDRGGAQWRQGVRGSRGDEAPVLEAVEALPLLPSPRRPHCSNCAMVETLPLLDEGLRRSGNSVYLDRCRRAGPDLGPTCLDLGSDFFLKTNFGCQLGTGDMKNNLLFVS
jgi:hypothetical protein